MIEALTNNRARTAPDLRAAFERHGGNLGSNGSVAFQFTKSGVITLNAGGVDEDDLMESALEAGAEDVRNEGEVFEVVTQPTAFHKVKDALAARDFTIENAEVTYLPQNTVAVDGEKAQTLLKLIDLLEDNDDVQTVSHNGEL
jgi:YebC/PmpR family DNA-binding regulatory protein